MENNIRRFQYSIPALGDLNSANTSDALYEYNGSLVYIDSDGKWHEVITGNISIVNDEAQIAKHADTEAIAACSEEITS